jgi:hypothetical protein
MFALSRLSFYVRDKMKKLFGLLSLLLLPLWICIVFYVFPLGSVGVMVPISLILLAIALPVYLCCWLRDIREDSLRLFLQILSVPAGIFLAVLSINLYFPLTAWLLLDDFQWM